LYSGVYVGVVVTPAEADLHALADGLVGGIKLRQAQGGDEGADQPSARQVYAFAEYAAQHGEANALPCPIKLLQERMAAGLAHLALLRPGRHRRVARLQPRKRQFQVVKTAEKSQVVTALQFKLPRHRIDQGVQ